MHHISMLNHMPPNVLHSKFPQTKDNMEEWSKGFHENYWKLFLTFGVILDNRLSISFVFL